MRDHPGQPLLDELGLDRTRTMPISSLATSWTAITLRPYRS